VAYRIAKTEFVKKITDKAQESIPLAIFEGELISIE
jgi:hypothetical protein